ncbi:Glutaredoxin-related protein [Actinobacillus equuli]|uniref:hypothetical protein n=1 Tax=Actinobacillus equuli TaxID=718 RepID=UPI000F6EBD6A|nr:hypothetical protein [Actinobacillus equuli]WGE57195.1 hypothetical protein NYR71_00090 [Actinobacillus equuli subsp. equuli]VEI48965.1 Glutaredoxin-related protein [Actinobacillus equuli]
MKPIVYFAPWCPDTAPFFAELERLNIDVEKVDMVGNPTGLKAFLKLRDNHTAFDDVKKNGYIGIPELVLENGNVVLDKDQLAEIFSK